MSRSVHVQFDEAVRQAVLLAEALGAGQVGMVVETGRGNVALPVNAREASRWLNTPLSLSEIWPDDVEGWINRK